MGSIAVGLLGHTAVPSGRARWYRSGTGHRGYTLVELLVVMILLGIAAGAVTLSVAPSEERRVTEELLRLGALFRLAQDEARTTGRPITWEAGIDGYRFRRGDPAPIDAGDDPLRPRRWPFGVTAIDAPAIVFGREPLLERTGFRIVAQSRQWRVDIDALGRVSLAQ